MNDLWNSAWPPDTHETDYAKKRIKSAEAAKMTPVSVDTENWSAVFKGSGKTPYNTTLEKCTCVDFVRNKLPCKHIYRLAMDLGIVGGRTESYASGARHSWTEVADIVETLSDAAQSEFLSLIRGMRNDETKTCRKKKGAPLYELVGSGVLTAGRETPKYLYVTIPGKYTAEIYRTYQYFNRKFNPPVESGFDFDGTAETYDFKPLANDDRTERLVEKGFAVRTEGGVFIRGSVPEKYLA